MGQHIHCSTRLINVSVSSLFHCPFRKPAILQRVNFLRERWQCSETEGWACCVVAAVPFWWAQLNNEVKLSRLDSTVLAQLLDSWFFSAARRYVCLEWICSTSTLSYIELLHFVEHYPLKIPYRGCRYKACPVYRGQSSAMPSITQRLKIICIRAEIIPRSPDVGEDD